MAAHRVIVSARRESSAVLDKAYSSNLKSLDPEKSQYGVDCIIVLNCLYYLTDFDLKGWGKGGGGYI